MYVKQQREEKKGGSIFFFKLVYILPKSRENQTVLPADTESQNVAQAFQPVLD